jgi:glucokinase
MASRILLGDIGGTNARFALLERGVMQPVEIIPDADHPDFASALIQYLAGHRDGPRVDDAILAVAGPVHANRCALTNGSWIVDGATLCDAFGMAEVRVINDFEAVAWALPHLTPDDLFAIGGGTAAPEAPAAVLGAGTGLGLACLIPGPDRARVFGTEGGHATLASESAREDTIIAALRQRFGHVSRERVLSGGGLENLYGAIRSIDRLSAPDRSAAEITQAAASGTCRASRAALDMFCAMLGSAAGDVALTFGARGGIFIAGGIVPRIIDYLAMSQFRARFEAKGRMQPYLAAIPTNIIMHADPAFVGLHALARELFDV